MKNAYLAINNYIIRDFIEESGLFNIESDINLEYDILFCDTLSLSKGIKSKIKVYIASNYFEYLDNSSKYEDFDYFIGFGKEIYESFRNSIGFIPSEVLDGFVRSENIENSYTDDFSQNKIILLNSQNNFYDLEKDRFIYSQSIMKEFSVLLEKSNFRFLHNFPLSFASNKEKYTWYYEIPNIALEQCYFLFFDSPANCRMYFSNDIKSKSIISHSDFMFYNDIFNNKSVKKSFSPSSPMSTFKNNASKRNMSYKEHIKSGEDNFGMINALVRANKKQDITLQEKIKRVKQKTQDNKDKIINENNNKAVKDINDFSDETVVVSKSSERRTISLFLRYEMFSEYQINFHKQPLELFSINSIREILRLKEYFDDFDKYCSNIDNNVINVPDCSEQFRELLISFSEK
ncbi:MAG: hypothetical protein ACOCV1_05375 [Bacillota bacterium]